MVFPRARVVGVMTDPEAAEERHLPAFKKKKIEFVGRLRRPGVPGHVHFSAKDALGRSLFGLLKDGLGACAVPAEYRWGS